MSDKSANYAVTEKTSRKRRFTEQAHPYRTEFERDRDRIMHCAAFRRLEGKTQVFMPGENDHYRTRLTHSIEVAQIGRTIAKVLNLNESLTEAVCLAHDLGHSPFGHNGEKALNKIMTEFGGFEHNCQTMRIVDLLEHPYPDFAGLNLMYETRLGLALHHSPYDNPKQQDFNERNCSLEGQIADIADRIAYNCHDLEDGMRAGLINEEQIKNIELVADAHEKINIKRINDYVVRRTRTSKTIIDILVSDVINTSKNSIHQSSINSLDKVYRHPTSLITLSSTNNNKLKELENFLLNNIYLNEKLLAVREQTNNWLMQAFDKFTAKPDLMPNYFQNMIEQQGLQRTVCDYISGMTDRYCLSILKD